MTLDDLASPALPADADPFIDLPERPYGVPDVRDVPGILPSAWERTARPWERRTPHPPEWWMERAAEFARAAADHTVEASKDRLASYAVACRRRGEMEAAIRAARTPDTDARLTIDTLTFGCR